MPESQSCQRPRLLAIVGPTAVGKTELALKVAERLPVEIISADSRQVYRRMDIGSAKPTPDQLRAVSHHMVDIIWPDADFSLAEFVSGARNIIQSVNLAGRTPVLAGGTGQYVMAILEGWNVPSVPPNPDLRRELEIALESDGLSALLDRLRDSDPEALDSIDVRNPRRVIRAIEIATAGKGGRVAPRRSEPGFDALVIGLNMERSALYECADARVDRMMEDGFLDEVGSLLALGYGPDLPSMSAIGYHELSDHLLNGADLSEVVQKIKYRTRNYIRRQSNWFKRDDPRIRWFEPSEMDSAIELMMDWIAPTGREEK